MRKFLPLLVSALACLPALPGAAMGQTSAPRSPASSSTPGRVDALTRALDRGRLTQTQYALERARSAFDRRDVRAEFGDVARVPRTGATPVLRDLALHLSELTGSERMEAEAILARPTDDQDRFGDEYGQPSTKACVQDVCVHWVESGPDAPDLTDSSPADGTPDWIALNLQVLQDEVWAKEIDGLGYRAPKSDRNSASNGGNGKLDVYLADIGSPKRGGFYGYCASDDPKLRRFNVRFTNTSAYCVLENDFSPEQFEPPLASGETALRVTAAHEFFHAVQFAYDMAEDFWFMEGTATWIEDQVYDEIDDNLQFLAQSPLTDPQRPLDYFKLGTVYQYGNFIWWQYLTERKGNRFVRRVWNRADGSREGPNDYSVQALKRVLAKSKSSLPRAFSRFGFANLALETSYEEGESYASASNGGPQPSKTFVLGSGNLSTREVVRKVDHLSTHYLSFEPGSGIRNGDRLRVSIEGPRRRTSPRANLIVFSRDGSSSWTRVKLDSEGEGRAGVDFGPHVERVVLLLTNASGRFRCGTEGPGSTKTCRGTPRDDNKKFAFRAQLRR
ncbi:MAG: MXAN_6640 family putative metalloprotease [Actinomycetota bacterium]